MCLDVEHGIVLITGIQQLKGLVQILFQESRLIGQGILIGADQRQQTTRFQNPVQPFQHRLHLIDELNDIMAEYNVKFVLREFVGNIENIDRMCAQAVHGFSIR